MIYNIENYFIRLNSVYDRMLQLINAVFHLSVNPESVGHSVIISNLKVSRRTEIKANIKQVKKYLETYSQKRNTLIHKHSWRDVKLRKLELFYLNRIEEMSISPEGKKRFKNYRAQKLKEYITEQKGEFAQINKELAAKIDPLFLSLKPEYLRQKQRIESSPW